MKFDLKGHMTSLTFESKLYPNIITQKSFWLSNQNLITLSPTLPSDCLPCWFLALQKTDAVLCLFWKRKLLAIFLNTAMLENPFLRLPWSFLKLCNICEIPCNYLTWNTPPELEHPQNSVKWSYSDFYNSIIFFYT